MFTGIVEALGRVRQLAPGEGTWRLEISAPELLDHVGRGESVAVNGACLTVSDHGDGFTAFDLGPETLNVTTLGDLRRNDPVNLERPLRLGAPLGGHLVSGHVDGVGTICRAVQEADTLRMTIQLPAGLDRYLIPKGSVAVDGVSLTVAAVHEDGRFDIMVIPHTLKVTTLGEKGEGARVNVEMDMLGKYVCRLLSKSMGTESESLNELLIRHEFGRQEPLHPQGRSHV